MNLVRVFASAVVRRLAVLVVGAVLALLAVAFGIGKAHAGNNVDQGAAYAACLAGEIISIEASPTKRRKGTGCVLRPVTGDPNRYECYYDARFTTSDPWMADYGSCGTEYFPVGQTCLVRPSEFDWANGGETDSGLRCFNGCTYQNTLTVGGEDSGRYEAYATGDVCAVGDHPPPALDSDGDGEPDETDAFPNDPTETKDTDGDGIGDNADFAPEDPTDGKDTEGEEDGDDEGDNQASGGGTCAAAPTCKGDGIQCAQLWQQWKTRCEGTAQGKVTGNVQDCASAVTVTSPDAVANAQLLALRTIACKDGGEGEGGGNVGDANNNGVADVLEGVGTEGEDPGEEDEVTKFGMGLNPSMLNEENIFGGGQCPSPPSFPIMGTTINPGSMPYFCQIMAIARVMILLFGGFTAVMILMGGRL